MEGDVVTKRIVVLIIVCVSSAIALATITAAIIHPYVSTLQTPSILENWGGLIIGFYFGTFVSLLKEWLTSMPNQDTGVQKNGEGIRKPNEAIPADRNTPKDR